MYVKAYAHSSIPTYIVKIGIELYEMSSNADQPNGVNMYAGREVSGDGSLEKDPELKEVMLGDLPKGTLLGIIRRMDSQIESAKEFIVDCICTQFEFGVACVVDGLTSFMTEEDYKNIDDSRE